YVCAATIGAAPDPRQMRFAFNVQLDVANDSEVPLPAVEALAAFTAYPQAQGQRNLGAVCMSLCDSGASCQQQAANACSSTEPPTPSMRDFAQGAAGFLFAVATGQESIDNLRIRTIAAHAQTRVVFQLELDTPAVLALIQTLGQDELSQIREGRVPQFS